MNKQPENIKDKIEDGSSGKSQSFPLDQLQKDAINADLNSVVSAGAGSGKTTVLAKRFTRLVLEKGCNVDEILTLTFTKKATVEMSSRIYSVLLENAPQQAANFYKANIKTIDGYCNAIAKMGAHLYGISPDFVQDDSISSRIHQMALPFILEHRNNPALKDLIKTKSIETIANELFVNPVLKISTVAEPIDYKKCLEKQAEEILRAWNKQIDEGASLVKMVYSIYETIKDNKTSKTAQSLKKIFEENPEPQYIKLTSQMIIDSEYEPLYDVQSYLANIGALRLNGVQNADLKETIYSLRDVSDILCSIVNYVYGIRYVNDLIPLLEEFQQKANDLKRHSGLLTFKDISNLALCILRDYPEIRQIEKSKYKAIMIDEFQDNNQDQRDMLFMLAEKEELCEKGVPDVKNLCKDKLFFVGDEKQSIYKFRGADVSVFRALSKDFEEGNLTMVANHRSKPALISSFNTIFGGISYPQKNDSSVPSVFFTEKDAEQNADIPEYEPVYHEVTLSDIDIEKMKNFSSEEIDEVYKPRVHFAFYDKNQPSEPHQLTDAEAEAEWVAKKIKELMKGDKDHKPIPAEKIAVLIRTYACQPLYERTFLNHGIPYNSETLTGFFSDGPVNDIFSLLRICVYKTDSLSYAQVLRSPFVNLSIEECNAVIMKNQIPFEADCDDILIPSSLKRYNHAKEFFNELQQLSLTERITSLVTKIWYEAGYRYETKWNLTVKLYEKLYDYVFELARQAEQSNMGLAAFVDSMRDYEDLSAKMDGMDIPMESTSGVHILTIHKSKGLEYPVVFMVNTQGGSQNNTNASPIYCSKNYGIVINTPTLPAYGSKNINYFYNQTNNLEYLKASAELRRLVYVAMTRAEHELYITNGKYAPIPDAADKFAPGNKVTHIIDVLAPVINYYNPLPVKDEITGEFITPEPPSPSPFTFEQILPCSRFVQEGLNIRKNTDEDKMLLLSHVDCEKYYSEDKTEETEIIPQKYMRPSHLHNADDETNPSKSPDSDEKAPYPEIGKIVRSSIPKSQLNQENPEPRFKFTDFGSIAHAYLEAAINKEEPKIPAKYLIGLENNKTNEKKIHQICCEMRDNFIASDLGKKALESCEHLAEYDFRSKVDGKIVRGQIDLLFQNKDGSFCIVDYKTNTSMEPEVYYTQLACYRQAVSKMMNVPPEKVSCYLYYLRFNKSIDITEQCSEIELTFQK